MKTRITALDLGRIAPIFTGISGIRYVIECKHHWWSRWRIRDWESEHCPTFYKSEEEARRHL